LAVVPGLLDIISHPTPTNGLAGTNLPGDSRFRARLAGDSRARQHNRRSIMKLIVFVLEGKGGACKSTSASVCVEALMQDGKYRVDVIDTDTTNSTMSSLFPDAKLVDMSHAEFIGHFLAALKSDSDFVVVDTGARDESRLRAKMKLLAQKAKEAKVQILVLRPITTSSFVQNNAISWEQFAHPLGIRTIFVRALCQGRTDEHFTTWTNSIARKDALARGAVEVDLTDAGVRWADEVPAYGISFREVALGDFSRVASDDLEMALETFNEAIQAHLGFWAEENAIALKNAFAQVGIKL
jgi:hypothetical protein